MTLLPFPPKGNPKPQNAVPCQCGKHVIYTTGFKSFQWSGPECGKEEKAG